MTPAAMRLIAIQELFIDMHCGFYNGYVTLPDTGAEVQRAAFGRRNAHLAQITRYVEISDASQSTRCDLLAPAMEDKAFAAKEAGDWVTATTAATELVRMFPEESRFVELLAGVYFGQALSKMSKGEDDSSCRRDASVLADYAQMLDKLVADKPECLAAYDFASQLHHIRAVRLANGDLVAVAMTEIYKARAYWPGLDFTEDIAAIRTRIEQTQMQAAQQEAMLRKNSRMSLTESGVRVREQAKLGVGPAEEFAKSAQVAKLAKAWESAQLRAFWRRVGLPVPEANWDEKAQKLLQAISSVRAKTADGASFGPLWDSVARGDEDLASIDPAKVQEFVAPLDGGVPIPPPIPAPVPVLRVTPVPKNKGSEPFGYWVFSRRNPGLKAVGALALMLLLTAIVLGSWHGFEGYRRDQAWAEIRRTTESGDDLGRVEACERFFSTSPSPVDPRNAEAREALASSLTRWFATLPGKPDGTALDHVQRYREISAKWQSQGGTL
jgi:hypothetical protein